MTECCVGLAMMRVIVAVAVIVTMVVPVGWWRCAAFAVHPARIAAAIVFLLPDRHSMLHFIDDEAAGIEGLAAMHGADAHPHGHVAQSQRADAMDAQGVLHREASQGFGDDAFAFLHGEFLERLVFQTSDLLSLVVIANPALEAHVSAGARIEQLAPRLGGV